MTRDRVETHRVVDERGALVCVEFAAVPFPVQRAFVVTGPPGGADRGGHPAPCGEAVLLVSGSATFVVAGSDGTTRELVLDEPGQTLVLNRGEHVDYRLHDEHSRLLVLAEDPYGTCT